MLSLLAILLSGYLVGSIPTSIITGKVLRGIDIREHGSGNAGATNVLRVLGWKPAVVVMLVDVGKGALATLVCSRLRIDPIALDPIVLRIIAGSAAVVGHVWTIFAGFRGGKGVGTAGGMLIALYPIAALVCLIIFGTLVATTRYVSVGSISAAIALPVVLILLDRVFGRPVPSLLFDLSLVMTVLIVFTHRSNIKRLIQGTENRIGRRVRNA